MTEPRPLISYVFPIYDEEGNIDLLHEQVSAAVATLDLDVEMVFVNDGSTDGSRSSTSRATSVTRWR